MIKNEDQRKNTEKHLDFQSVTAQDKFKDTCYDCKDEFRTAGYLQRNLQLAAAGKQRGLDHFCAKMSWFCGFERST